MQRTNLHAYASHTPILSQPGWSASRPSPFAIKSQTNVWAAWPRCCRDGLRFGERVPEALLISCKRKRHSTYSLVTPHQQFPSHTITANATAFSTTPARHMTSTLSLHHPISCSLTSSASALCPA